MGSNRWLLASIALILLALAVYPVYVGSGGFIYAATFWGLLICAQISLLVWGRFRVSTTICLLGAMMNATVIMANGGYMPVIGLVEESGAWRTAHSDSHLLLFADRMAVGGFSPGDFLLILALVGLLVRAIAGFSKKYVANLRQSLTGFANYQSPGSS